MNKNIIDLLADIKAKKEAVINLASENKLDEAEAAKNELIDMQKKLDLIYDLEEEEDEKLNSHKGEDKKPLEPKDSIKEFANAARRGFRNQMSEGSQPDGGYTVPEDIRTRIEEYRDSKASLRMLVDIENVTAPEGARTFKKRSQQTGFSEVGEGAKIGKKETPQFERITYKIKKYAGWFPVTNELLKDSDANIANVIITWIGDESRITANKLIVEKLKSKAEVAITGIDDIKKVLNVNLGSAFKSTSRIITNDDGLQYLDTLKDSDGRYLLQPNPAKPMEMRLCAGATTIPVEIVPNNDLKTEGNKIPFFIGDLKEAVKFFDRKRLEIKVSDSAVVGDLNAYEEDLTFYRAIEREDVVIKDEKAFEYCTLSVKGN